MTTHFITAEVEINANQEAIAQNLEQAIEQTLAAEGEPLRWAITAINEQVDAVTAEVKKIAQVEAVVTRP
ncbi:hypothetical protein H6F44_05425 [Pseudanabaena sp. FACHB-1277]|jgi:hypothetical protein|uniref:Uncharacterized protein n=1 Tax=Pseudanabaena cinerea FACHB-1277 TaxID=2949581 RepID=A0A926UR69_9CYAN|nr:hypothetical protein [Pseudanabaena cinerea]MBD2149567.1 hypothetical protein [Pseudanabaena cinerea FACHB-1277]